MVDHTELLDCRRTTRQLNQEATERLRNVGLSVAAFEVLYWLQGRGPQPQYEIEGWTGATKASVSEMCRGLEEGRLIRRTTPAQDRRQKLVEITPTGGRRFKSALRALEREDT